MNYYRKCLTTTFSWGNTFFGCRETEDRWCECEAASGLGQVYSALGDHARALTFFRREADLVDEIGPPAVQARAHLDMATAHEGLGDLASAGQELLSSLGAAAQAGDQRARAIAHAALGILFFCCQSVSHFFGQSSQLSGFWPVCNFISSSKFE